MEIQTRELKNLDISEVLIGSSDDFLSLESSQLNSLRNMMNFNDSASSDSAKATKVLESLRGLLIDDDVIFIG